MPEPRARSSFRYQQRSPARRGANHINIAYAPSAREENQVLAVKLAMLHELDIRVYLGALLSGHKPESHSSTAVQNLSRG